MTLASIAKIVVRQYRAACVLAIVAPSAPAPVVYIMELAMAVDAMLIQVSLHYL